MKRERGMMGTRVQRERGPLPITPFVSALLNNLLKCPPEIASDWGRGRVWMRVFFFTKGPFLSRFPLNVIQQVKVSIVLQITRYDCQL